MEENNNTQKPQNDFDLDAALEEKFQQVQQDVDRLRAMNANADAQQAAENDAEPEAGITASDAHDAAAETASPTPAEEPEADTDTPQFDVAELR